MWAGLKATITAMPIVQENCKATGQNLRTKFRLVRLSSRAAVNDFRAVAFAHVTEKANARNSKVRQWRAVMPVETGENSCCHKPDKPSF